MADIRPVLTDKGLILSDTEQVKAAVEQMFKNALGQDMNTAADTPQGQLISSIVAMVMDKDAQMLELYNNFDPASSSGVWQDALAALYMLERKPALPSYAQVLCSGLPGTYIPGKQSAEGPAMAINTGNIIFLCSSGGYIGEDGTVTLQFESENTGPIPVPSNSITRIYKVLPGWDSCNNLTSGVIGRDVENRLTFEKRRQDSVAKNASGTVGAILSSVSAVDGVIDCFVDENTSNETVIKTNVPLLPHSVFVSVVGGTAQDVATAIFVKKSAGCDYNGNTAVIITAENGVPYEVKFERPASVDIKVKITVIGNMANIREKVIAAVMANFYGTDGSSLPVKIGGTIYASRFYCSLTAFSIVKVEVGLLGGEFSDSVTMQINQVAVLSENNITVTEILEQ